MSGKALTVFFKGLKGKFRVIQQVLSIAHFGHTDGAVGCGCFIVGDDGKRIVCRGLSGGLNIRT